MKKLIKFLAVVLPLTFISVKASSSTWTYGDYLINDPTLAYATSPVLDTENISAGKGPIDNLSMQVTYATATISAFTFIDGTPSAGTFTVLSTSTLTAARGTNTITVTTQTVPASASITLQGTVYTANAPNGWPIGTNSTTTAANIQAKFNSVPGFTASVSSNVVTLSCASSGTLCNSIGLSVNTTTLLAGAALFNGGANNLVVGFGGFTVTAGTDFTPVSTASGTASAISAAFGANASLAAIAGSTWATNGVVYSTMVTAGTAGNSITMFTNSSSVTASGFSGGTASSINTSASSIRLPTHGISTGYPLLYTKTAGTSPGTLTANTTYFAVVVDANNIKLASSSSNALAGTTVGITTQTVAGGGTFVLTPPAWSGSAGFYWQSSNDNTNFFTISISSVTISSSTAQTTTMWDGTINYRYLRFVYNGPTFGGVNIKVKGNGKSFQ